MKTQNIDSPTMHILVEKRICQRLLVAYNFYVAFIRDFMLTKCCRASFLLNTDMFK